MAWTADVVAGLAQHLAAAGVGTYSPAGAYTSAQVGIFMDVVPAAPDRVVTVTPYGAADDPTLSDSVLMVQVRVRGTKDPRTAYDLDDAVFAAMQNLPRSILNGVTVVGAWRTSAGYLGPDGNGRHERTSNYRLTVHRPTPNRT